MIVVAIIGILAAVALPAYQDYTTRAKVSEVILAASAPRTQVSEAAATIGGLPSTASITIASMNSKYVKDVTYKSDASNTATVTAEAKDDGRIAGKTIVLKGEYKSETGQVIWTCGGTIEPKYRPASCQDFNDDGS